jgi:hypothetical protein
MSAGEGEAGVQLDQSEPPSLTRFPFKLSSFEHLATIAYSTNSALASAMSGTFRPSAFTVVRLMTQSNLVGS